MGARRAVEQVFGNIILKMQAFDSPGTAEILTIRPQDIGFFQEKTGDTATIVFSFTAIITTAI